MNDLKTQSDLLALRMTVAALLAADPHRTGAESDKLHETLVHQIIETISNQPIANSEQQAVAHALEAHCTEALDQIFALAACMREQPE